MTVAAAPSDSDTNVNIAAGQLDMPGYMRELDIGPPILPRLEASFEEDTVRHMYEQRPTSELLSIYNQQQEELVKLSKELEQCTKNNIELSTTNLQRLQKLHDSSSPVTNSIVMQPLSQFFHQVRQQSQRGGVPALGEGGSFPHRGGSGDLVHEGSCGGSPVGRHRSHAHGDSDDERGLHGICTQEDAATILLQMSQHMVKDSW